MSRGHKLLTAELKKKLPPLYSGEKLEDGTNALALVKFFSPYSGWTWYASEFDGEDLFFGVVEGFEREYGYFSLKELDETMFKGIVPAVERDLYWTPRPLKECV